MSYLLLNTTLAFSSSGLAGYMVNGSSSSQERRYLSLALAREKGLHIDWLAQPRPGMRNKLISTPRGLLQLNPTSLKKSVTKCHFKCLLHTYTTSFYDDENYNRCQGNMCDFSLFPWFLLH